MSKLESANAVNQMRFTVTLPIIVPLISERFYAAVAKVLLILPVAHAIIAYKNHHYYRAW